MASCTCAGDERRRAYDAVVEREVDAYAHVGTREEITEQARTLVVERGYALPGWDGTRPGVTPWRDSGNETRERYRVELTPGASGWRVRLTHHAQERMPPTFVRDSRRRAAQLEDAVLTRIHPETAAHSGGGGSFEYDVAPAIVWDATQAELSAHGAWISVAEPPVDVEVSSAWAVRGDEHPSRTRYDVTLVRVREGVHRLEAYRVVERGTKSITWRTTREHRDYEGELDLIRRRDPTAAGTIETEATKAGEEAYARALDHGGLACSVR